MTTQATRGANSGRTIPELSAKQLASFQSRIAEGPGCHIWTGAVWQTSGYGTFGISGFGPAGAHRIAYTLTHGPLKRGQVVRHSCGNRLCVNPAHLSAGTQTQNMQDEAFKFATGPKLKDSPLQVAFIKGLYDAKLATQAELADAFSVSTPSINRIVNGISYSDIEPLSAASTLITLALLERAGGTAGRTEQTRHGITEQDALEIRRLYQTREMKVSAIAQRFGVHATTVRNIGLSITHKNLN